MTKGAEVEEPVRSLGGPAPISKVYVPEGRLVGTDQR